MTQTAVLQFTHANTSGSEAEYVVGASCSVYHSGNRRLYRSQRGYLQCGGCGTHYSDEQVIASIGERQTPKNQ